MESKVYKYMDWPEIEAVVYAEEASPRDLMAPRLTADGVLVQGFFPDAEKAEVLVDRKTYEMDRLFCSNDSWKEDSGISVSNHQRKRDEHLCRPIRFSCTDYRS